MPAAVALYRGAQRHLKALGAQKAGRLVLSLFFKAVVGIQRIFHFETLDDAGFAILTGGPRVLGRTVLGGLVRAAPTRGVMRLVSATAPKVRKAAVSRFSIDEHAVARFTRKFSIRKGFHTIRNKHMKVEKLFFPFDLISGKLLPLIVTHGSASLGRITQQLLPSLRRRARGAQLRIILDAGAAQNHATLLKLTANPRQITLVRTPRRASYLKAWKQLTNWTRLEEPGPFAAAPAKVIHVTETRTRIRDGSGGACEHDTRTIVIREQRRRGKDRWHALWVFGDEQTDAYELVQEFRTRQHHEQAYRVMLHDAHVDTTSSGYYKKSPNPARPGFRRNAVTLYAWLAACATNAMLDLSARLPLALQQAHPRTLRRWLLNVPADIFVGTNTLVLLLRPRRLRSVWECLVREANARNTTIPWMQNRRLVLSLEPCARPSPRAAACFDPAPNAAGVWC